MFRHIVKEQLKVPAHIDYLGELRDFVTHVGKRHGFSERVINAFKLSIDEAATNIIKHAYRDWSGDITIRAIVKKSALTIVLIDQGKYFDPRQVGDPDLQRYVDIGKKGGLGIFIMRRLLDQIDYRKTEEGNELWLVKNREGELKKKLSVSSIPLSLKAKYWVISIALFTIIMVAVYLFFFITRDNLILNDYLERGKGACSVLARGAASRIGDLDPTVQEEIASTGGRDIQFLLATSGAIETLGNSQHNDIMFMAFIVDVANEIKAISNDAIFKEFDVYQIPNDHNEIQAETVYKYKLPPDSSGVQVEVLDIIQKVVDEDGTLLCNAHFLIDYQIVSHDINSARLAYFNLALLIWVIGVASLFLLIYLVMNPFRRLQDWVKAMGQPGVVEEMDIDATSEVGEIAKAFSDITQKLRISQENVAEQERLQKEMQVAQEIQQTLLPSEFPELDGYELASYYAAAKEVGGDYFDFVEVDQDTLGIVVGDVSGKGVPGSLVMTMIRTALRTEARGLKDAAEVLAKVNDFVINDIKKGMFVTLFYVIIDSRKRKLNYASAGHNPMILYRGSSNKTYYLNPRGFPIGISLPDKELFRKSIESDSIALTEDDILLVYTDGITEAMNAKRHLYGEERFLDVVRNGGGETAQNFVDTLHSELLSFTEGTPQNDDITLVAIKEKTTADKLELKRAKNAFKMIQDGSSIKEACKTAGITIYAYNKKYRKQFEKEGIEDYALVADSEPLESKHLSIEEKTKIYDIIGRKPEFGAKKISDELLTDHYSNTKISVSRIYEELVRARLNTKELREAYVSRGGKRKRLKPPGTPMLTIDGKVIVQKNGFDADREPEPEIPPLETDASDEENAEPVQIETETIEQEKKDDESVDTASESDEQTGAKDILDIGLEDLISTPLEDLFDKRGSDSRSAKDDKGTTKEPENFEYVDESEFQAGEYIEDTEQTAFEYAEESGDEISESNISLSGQDVDQEVQAKAPPKEEPTETEHVIVDGPSPIEELYLSDRENLSYVEEEGNDIEELMEIPQEYVEEPTEADIQDDDEVKDIAIDNQVDSRDKVEPEEVDFTEFVLDGGGLDEPEPVTDEAVEFTEAEDVEYVEEETSEETLDLGDLSSPFDDLLEIEEEHGLITPTGELTKEVNLPPVNIEPEELEEPEPAVFVDESVFDSPKVQSVEEPELTFEELLDEIETENTFQNVDEEFDNLLEEAVVVDGGELSSKKDLMSNAREMYESKDYNSAIPLLDEFVQQNPNDTNALSILSDSLFQMKKYNEATKSYERLVSLDGTNAKALENLGIIYANRGNLEKAIFQWEQLLKINPERQDIQDSINRVKKYMNL